MAIALAAGPVFFNSQLTISSAVRPPCRRKRRLLCVSLYELNFELVNYHCSLMAFHLCRIWEWDIRESCSLQPTRSARWHQPYPTEYRSWCPSASERPWYIPVPKTCSGHTKVRLNENETCTSKKTEKREFINLLSSFHFDSRSRKVGNFLIHASRSKCLRLYNSHIRFRLLTSLINCTWCTFNKSFPLQHLDNNNSYSRF